MRAEVAIVGGGPSGLIAGYRLRDRDILLLEREPEVGGNARSDTWHGLIYPAGAIVTHAGSPAMDLYDELGLRPTPLPDPDPPITFIGARRVEGDVWGEPLERMYSPNAVRSIRNARLDLLQIDAEGSKKSLDEMTLAHLLDRYRPEVREWFDCLLAWFAGGTHDFSAYVGVLLARSQMGHGLGILYPERTSDGGRYSFPGGLGAVTAALRNAVEAGGTDRVWTDSTVRRVEQDGDGVLLTVRRNGSTCRVRARAAIIATSKLVARRIVADLPRRQKAAMGAMRYATILTAAIGADGPGTGDVRSARTLDAPVANIRDMSTDPERQLLRCEVPIRRGTERTALLEGSLHSLGRAIAAYLDQLFPGMYGRIDQVRIWRWAQNWYLPVPRMVTRIQPTAGRPFGRIFFANADRLGPVSEFGWAMLAAERAVTEMQEALRPRAVGSAAARPN